MNKKAMAWISWILLLGVVVSASAVIIIWAQDFTTSSTESTVQYVTGRSDCRSVSFSVDEGSTCNSIKLTNRGLLTIKEFTVNGESNSEKIKQELLINQKEMQIQKDLSNLGNQITVIPIIDSSGQKFGCIEKKVIITC